MKVRLFKNQKPLCNNLNKWNKSECPLLLITGLSGSGKTTYAKKIAKKNNAIFMSFDVLKFYTEAPKESQIILKLFLKEYPQIKELINIHWTKTDVNYSNDILYNYFCNIFFDFLMAYGKKHNKKIVLEGIQMFIRLHPSKSIGLPLIIIRSSSLQSCVYKAKRDYKTRMGDAKELGYIYFFIKDLYIYQIKQRLILNRYINYHYTLHKYRSLLYLKDKRLRRIKKVNV